MRAICVFISSPNTSSGCSLSGSELLFTINKAVRHRWLLAVTLVFDWAEQVNIPFLRCGGRVLKNAAATGSSIIVRSNFAMFRIEKQKSESSLLWICLTFHLAGLGLLATRWFDQFDPLDEKRFLRDHPLANKTD